MPVQTLTQKPVKEILRPLSNNTKASSQCVNCLIFIHTVTTALSDCLLNIFTWQLYSHKSHSVISYYSSIQQGVDTHPCLVTIYRLFTDTGQEVSAPNVSKHNRHQLSHQLSVVIASTLYPAPDTIVSLYTESPNRIGGDIVLLDLRTTKSSTWSSIMSLFPVSTTSVTEASAKRVLQAAMHSLNFHIVLRVVTCRWVCHQQAKCCRCITTPLV